MSDEIKFTNRHGINIQYDDTLKLSYRRDRESIIRVSFETYEEFRLFFHDRNFQDINHTDITDLVEKSEQMKKETFYQILSGPRILQRRT